MSCLPLTFRERESGKIKRTQKSSLFSLQKKKKKKKTSFFPQKKKKKKKSRPRGLRQPHRRGPRVPPRAHCGAAGIASALSLLHDALALVPLRQRSLEVGQGPEDDGSGRGHGACGFGAAGQCGARDAVARGRRRRRRCVPLFFFERKRRRDLNNELEKKVETEKKTHSFISLSLSLSKSSPSQEASTATPARAGTIGSWSRPSFRSCAGWPSERRPRRQGRRAPRPRRSNKGKSPLLPPTRPSMSAPTCRSASACAAGSGRRGSSSERKL